MPQAHVKARPEADARDEKIGPSSQCCFRRSATRFKSVGYIPIETIAPDCLDDFDASKPTDRMKNAEHKILDAISRLTNGSMRVSVPKSLAGRTKRVADERNY